jgi:tetratricopeptide (TPR) repeat protein
MERKGLACLLFLALAGTGFARAADEAAALLQLNAPVSRDLRGGEIHLYRLLLKAGDYASIEVAQEGIDVQVVIKDPAGAVLAEVDSPTGRYSTEVASLMAKAAGEHGIEVRPLFEEAAGSYRLSLMALRPADRMDGLRIAAERADREAADAELARLAVERWRELGDRRREARALTRLGGLLITSGQHREGLAACEQALALLRPLGDRDGIAESLYQIGKASRLLGDRAHALASYEEAISLLQEPEKPDLLARAFLGAGVAHENFGEIEAALNAYDRALAFSRKMADPQMEASALNYLGGLHILLGQPRQAMEELRAALDLAHTLRGRRIEADVRTNLGALYQKLGVLQEAIDHIASALEIYREINDTPKQCDVLANLGGLLFQLGTPEDGRELFLRGLPLCQDPRKRALALLGLSRAEEQLGLPQDAAARLDEALQLQRSMSDSSGEADTLRTKGLLLLKTGEPAQARHLLLESVALFDRLGLRSGAVAARRALARAEADLGHLDAARRGFEDALAQAQALDDVGEQARVLACRRRGNG